MLRDAQGLDATTDSTKTITAIDQFVDQAFSYGKQADEDKAIQKTAKSRQKPAY